MKEVSLVGVCQERGMSGEVCVRGSVKLFPIGHRTYEGIRIAREKIQREGIEKLFVHRMSMQNVTRATDRRTDRHTLLWTRRRDKLKTKAEYASSD